MPLYDIWQNFIARRCYLVQAKNARIDNEAPGGTQYLTFAMRGSQEAVVCGAPCPEISFKTGRAASVEEEGANRSVDGGGGGEFVAWTCGATLEGASPAFGF